jgi:hypothetical protein
MRLTRSAHRYAHPLAGLTGLSSGSAERLLCGCALGVKGRSCSYAENRSVVARSPPGFTPSLRRTMIAFGVFLLILAVLFSNLAVLWGIGMLCIVVGIILFVASSLGHAVGGRRHYY